VVVAWGWCRDPGDQRVPPPLEALPLRPAQARLAFDQGIHGFDPAVLRSQPDQAANEVAEVRRRFLACSDGGLAVLRRLRRAGCGQLFGDVVEVDLEMVGQEVDRCALTSRKFDGDPKCALSSACP
jgi:hypothetical protein